MCDLVRILFVGCVVLTLTSSASAQEWATVKGQIVFAPEMIPVPAPINVDKDKEACLKNGPLKSDLWVIDPKSKGVKNAVVWLAPLTKGGAFPINPKLAKPAKDTVEIDQPCCMFEPRITTLREGQTLVVKNSAAIAHNVKWQGNPTKNPGGNVIIPPGKQHEIKDLVAERLPVSVNCSIHGWMEGKIAVFDHPYFTLTDKDGNFTIKDAPAGKYKLYVWHEGAGWLGGAAGSKGYEIDIKGDGADFGTKKIAPQ